MARIFYQQDCNLDRIRNKTVAVIGYGSQGHAHALNDRHQIRHALALYVLAADRVAGALGGDHDYVHVFRGNDLSIL